MEVRRGDIVLANFDPTKGSEQRGTRPAVVVQNDTGNRYANTTILAPLTTSYDPANVAPYEAEIRAANTVVDQDSVALLNQLRTMSIPDRIYDNFGILDPDGPEMAAIDEAIEISLGLR